MLSGACSLRACCLRLPYSPERPLLRAASLRLRRCRRVLSTACSASGAKKEKVIVISGPTGAGKSRLAIELAKRLNGEIISADSVQVYRGLDVGSAKPSPSDRKEIPHHLVDILDPYEEYSVGKFFEDARQATRCILDSGRVPIVAGGTGLYLRWFMYGKPDVPKASRDIASEVYSELADLQRNEDWDAAVQLVIKAGDPKAQFIAVNDWYRLRRSLEIIKSSGSPPSAFGVPYDSFREQCSSVIDSSHDVNSSADALEENESKDLDYDFTCFFLSTQRVDLYKSIDYRCEDMLSASDGILSEARWLLDTGLLPNSNSATRAIGYRQAMEYLSQCREQGGSSSPGEFFAFLSEFQKASRNFAKRQLTWFRNEHIYHWLDASKPLELVLNFIYDAYHDESRVLVVPEALRMKKDISNRRETSELKAYRTRNRHFVSRQDCSDILDWIKRTQG
ncbi:tRNA dimethylallyltransferase 9 [Alnus glutinosa]|uniref:tRNA dimethylallyltransferase 9 n=1 Tax=Alnus glutinosa TaxID=3517 RepID=UPI002D767AE6|nr:tRNA dimethylallyltransferase 9 [Alnus glutinosa]XP_062168811.1 tRNA dimethylallyltransferase 9 [Alnus glutinosa]XP_062168812.1 tRNA dimethylallyltransferase 9 [Alnus glutinosa]XP_062168813.1 tRNA dimethylallyltransferase 9 [Alnus glutinosa]